MVHLAGENVAGGRWTKARKARIRDSRVLGTRLLAETLAKLARPPRVLVSASAIGYYGDRGDEMVDETAPPGDGFLADVCKAWEAETKPAEDAAIRVVRVRIGVVLAERGGALEKMLTPFKLGLGGRIGDGQQWMPWVAIDDLVRAIRFALDTGTLTGAVNAVAPRPVRNREFTDTLGQVLGRPTVLPVPPLALKAALGGQMAEEMLLGGARVIPRALDEAGFSFAYPELEGALRHVVS